MAYSFATNCMNNPIQLLMIVFHINKNDYGFYEGLI